MCVTRALIHCEASPCWHLLHSVYQNLRRAGTRQYPLSPDMATHAALEAAPLVATSAVRSKGAKGGARNLAWTRSSFAGSGSGERGVVALRSRRPASRSRAGRLVGRGDFAGPAGRFYAYFYPRFHPSIINSTSSPPSSHHPAHRCDVKNTTSDFHHRTRT